jgi:hypothetical protein
METNTIELIGTIVVAMITAIFGPMGVEYLKLKFEKSPVNDDPVKKELIQSCVISDELEDIRIKLNADRVWITVIHNGGHFLHTNKSIQKFSVMHEVSRPGISSIGMVFKNIPISLFTKSTKHVMSGGVINITDVDDPRVATYGLKSALESVGTKAAISKGLFDITTSSLIGNIGADFINPKTLTDSEISFFIGRAERMSGFISNFIRDI